MRIIRVLKADQDLVAHFLAVLGRGLTVAGHSNAARPGFFIFAGKFIRGYLEPQYFRKEDVFLKALEDCGFAGDEGPVGNMRQEHEKSRRISETLFRAAKDWQGGDESGRAEVIFTTSEYTDLMRHHFDRLKNLIYPLLEQSVPVEAEENIAEDLNHIAFEDTEAGSVDEYIKMVQMLEDEVKEWEGEGFEKRLGTAF